MNVFYLSQLYIIYLILQCIPGFDGFRLLSSRLVSLRSKSHISCMPNEAIESTLESSSSPAPLSKPQKLETSIYISNLPPATTEESLRTLIGKYVDKPLGKVYLPHDTGTKKLKGFAFADLTDHDIAKEAVKLLHGLTIENYDRKLIVALRVRENQRTKEEKENAEALKQKLASLPKHRPTKQHYLNLADRTVYMRNMSFSLTKENILEMCEDLVGKDLVENIRFPLEKESNAPRGFCYIVFKDQATVDIAIEALDGVPVLGREIRVLKYNPIVP